jgi:hypothetical protein
MNRIIAIEVLNGLITRFFNDKASPQYDGVS